MKITKLHTASILLVFLSIISCTKIKTESEPLNVLWLTCEDISPLLAAYGDSTANTPNLNRLANESMVFTNVFATVGVCAPARSSIITGMYPTSIGTMHMRTAKDVFSWGQRDYTKQSKAKDIEGNDIPLYSAVVPPDVKCFTEYLRAENYYCTNNAKTDYQFAAPVTAWDENDNHAHWKNTPKGMPFFSVFNHGITHESRMWENKNLPLTVNPDSVPLPDYFPDTEIVRTDVARCYSNIELLDKQIGNKLADLEKEGLLDNTIIFFFSDHGGPLPRGKREHFDSGLKVPFMVRFPNAEFAGTYNQLVSFVDIAPTVLSLIGIKPPEHLQGRAFLGKYKSKDQRKYIFASGDRFDEFADRNRTVRSSRYLYVRNYYPELPRYKDVAYRKNMDMMNEMLQLNEQGALNNDQKIWFSESKPLEELYDCENDPYQLNNLLLSGEHAELVTEYKSALHDWQKRVGDKGSITEKELLSTMWPNGIQPKTADPKIEIDNNSVQISCLTQGASIAYIISESEIEPNLNSGWKLYTGNLNIEEGMYLYTLANRIGFADSEIIKLKIEG